MSQSSSLKSFLLEAGPLLLVLLIDGMGLGLVFPLLNALIMDPSATFIAASTSANTRNLIFGFTVGIFMLAWFFGAAFLGDLSDQIGRKKSLLICLSGTTIGYVLSAIAVYLDSYWLLLFGRVVAGFASGSQPIASAAIVDISSEEHKARNLGWMMFAISIGFILGPLVGGLLSDHDLFSSFNYSTPFIFAAAMSLLNLVLLQKLFHETFEHINKVKLHLHRAIEIFISAFKNEKVRALSFVLLILVFGWSGYYSFISMFLLRTYHFTALHVSIFMAVLGAGFGIGNGFLVEYCTKRFPLKKTVIVGMFFSAFCIAVTASFQHQAYAWLCAIPVGAGMSVVYSVLLAIFSNQVDADSQGWVMGITGSIMAFAFGMNNFLTGPMASIGAAMPLYISGGSLIIAAILLLMMGKNKIKTS